MGGLADRRVWDGGGSFSVSGINREEGWENRCVSGVSWVTVIVNARLDVLIYKV